MSKHVFMERVRGVLLVMALLVTSCQSPSLSGEAPQSQPVEVIINGQQTSFQDTLSLLPFLNLSQAELEAATELKFTLAAPISLQPYLFVGYAQDVTIGGTGPPLRLGTLVPEEEMTGQAEPRFFRRQEGYAGHTLLLLTEGKETELTLTFKQWIDKRTPRALMLMAPAYLETYANRGFSHFANGLFQGMIWILILYHLLLYWTVREPSYLWYCLYMVSISALTIGDFGYWQRTVFRNHPLWGWHLFQLVQYLAGILTLVYMRSFVDLRRLNPRWDAIVHWFIIGNFIILSMLALWYLPSGDGRGLQLVKLLVIPYAGFGLWVCYVLFRSGDVVARYFAVAGCLTAVSVALNAGAELFFPEPYPGTNFRRFYWIQAAVILHLLTFAFGMGYRRRQRDQELLRTRELDSLKTRFYTNITHEFRTPLTVILGMAGQLNEHTKARILIQRNATQLLRLINQLLGLSRLEARQLKPELQHGEVVGYFRYLSESFDSLAADKGIRLTFYTEQESIWLDHDPEKLQHIVFNLLSNAIKFTPSGGQVVLHLARIEQAGAPRLQFKVKDTGIGIPRPAQARIFDRFYQVDGSSTRKGEGTGVGLAYTRELVRLLGGDIGVASEEGKGATFRVTLPLRCELAAEAKRSPALETAPAPAPLPFLAPAAAPEKKTTGEIPHDERPLLLLVDDNADVTTYIIGLLKEDYRLRCADHGEAGLAAAREDVPDLILSDIMMPRMNGYELSKQLKSDPSTSHIPIILLTAKVTHQDKLAGLESGADVFLTKPFDRSELLLRIEKLLENRRRMRQYYAQEDLPVVVDSLRPDPETKFLRDLEAVVAERLDDPDFGVPDLATAVLMSQSQVYRKLKAVTGRTPSQFIRAQRLRRGRELLADPALNVSEIAYAVGFADPNYFSRTFNEEFGSNPSDWRRKISRGED